MAGHCRKLRALVRAAAAATILWAGGAAAKDEALEPTPPATESPEPSAPAGAPAGFDLGFGTAFTSQYISRGISLSGTQPAVQGYIEPSFFKGEAYLNIWASNTDFNDGFRGAEIDLTAGIRPKLGDLSLNLGYVHYYYQPGSVSPNYGEFFGKISLYGGVGYQFFEDPHAFEDLAWTAGLSYVWKSLTFDVRYWDTNLTDQKCVVRSGFEDGCDARVVGTVSLDLTWSKLMGRSS